MVSGRKHITQRTRLPTQPAISLWTGSLTRPQSTPLAPALRRKTRPKRQRLEPPLKASCRHKNCLSRSTTASGSAQADLVGREALQARFHSLAANWRDIAVRVNVCYTICREAFASVGKDDDDHASRTL